MQHAQLQRQYVAGAGQHARYSSRPHLAINVAQDVHLLKVEAGNPARQDVGSAKSLSHAAGSLLDRRLDEHASSFSPDRFVISGNLVQGVLDCDAVGLCFNTCL